VSVTLLRIWITLHARLDRSERAQTTAEYALVMLAAAAVAGLVLAWATKSHAITRMFDAVIDKVIP
jgi:cytochrome bd-type quinol oxidase subunit 2